MSWALFLDLLLGIALLGIASSTIFLGLAAAGTIRFHRDARRARLSQPAAEGLPPVSVLKPVHGAEARLKENLESFFRQDYPSYEILFAADEADDSALDVVRDVSARYPRIPCRILVTGVPPWPNPPAYCFFRMTEVAAHEILVTSDSDVEVAPNYLQEVVAPLLDPKVGMVTCVYRGKNVAGFWSGLTAIGMSVEMTAGVLVANLLEGINFGLGPTIAVKKTAVASIGGYEALGEYFANDYMIGKLIDRAGYRVALSHHVIDHVVSQTTFQKMWGSQLRWAKSTRYSRPKGHFGSGLIYAAPFGLLGFAAAALLGKTGLGLSLLVAACLNRVIESWLVGWTVVRDPVALKQPWMNVFRDLLGFAVWAASYTAARAVWRSSNYELRRDKIVLRENFLPTDEQR
ncbi:MAG TPA: bacteriohopanetetrol glucosamine biosynthesis glycosyltransferase HpnI [Bryobacteraceae bacterium]|jgi:ceramide glucosyltransferase|nr:bacteriohopanetetrol glucosamine biosynthesis glycosyltransferase HpnI [Bryobacteraceae bacterium]